MIRSVLGVIVRLVPLHKSFSILLFYNGKEKGKQHEKYCKGFHKSKKDFKTQQEHDKRKRKYAKDNKIDLLEIWYWDFDNIENILDNNLKEVKLIIERNS
jgi:hypothetical protein